MIATGDGADALTVDSGQQPTLGMDLVYSAGPGNNTLLLAKGSARIDNTTTGGTLDTTVHAGAHLSTSRLVQNGLTLANNSRVTLLADGGTSIVTSLNLGTDATLDIGNNALVIDYTGTSPVAAIRDRILSGRGGPGFGQSWNGAGITSNAVATANQIDPESRSIGYAENALLPLGAYDAFRGVAVDDTAVLIAYTRTGDANLDGLVEDSDVTVLGASFAPTSAGAVWALGDFEYNGFVDDSDATLLGVFYSPELNALARPAATAPAALAPGKSSPGLPTRKWQDDREEELINLLAQAIAENHATPMPLDCWKEINAAQRLALIPFPGS
jgi:hypothetical protein